MLFKTSFPNKYKDNTLLANLDRKVKYILLADFQNRTDRNDGSKITILNTVRYPCDHFKNFKCYLLMFCYWAIGLCWGRHSQQGHS